MRAGVVSQVDYAENFGLAHVRRIEHEHLACLVGGHPRALPVLTESENVRFGAGGRGGAGSSRACVLGEGHDLLPGTVLCVDEVQVSALCRRIHALEGVVGNERQVHDAGCCFDLDRLFDLTLVEIPHTHCLAVLTRAGTNRGLGHDEIGRDHEIALGADGNTVRGEILWGVAGPLTHQLILCVQFDHTALVSAGGATHHSDENVSVRQRDEIVGCGREGGVHGPVETRPGGVLAEIEEEQVGLVVDPAQQAASNDGLLVGTNAHVMGLVLARVPAGKGRGGNDLAIVRRLAVEVQCSDEVRVLLVIVTIPNIQILVGKARFRWLNDVQLCITNGARALPARAREPPVCAPALVATVWVPAQFAIFDVHLPACSNASDAVERADCCCQ
eukprot:comp11385_c0_seq1/m.5750 comp11385_c0_seq1/g.5750  ORF comp11385_c0_seq1/g.5750 comp11385_c0_seq1/m.5750 type:complete len:388 (+) comp11385_c0_seq1:750-1913(+)